MKTVLAIAGTDPTGGAGIQTDLKTIEAYGLYGMAVITVVIAQNTTGVFDMQPVSAALVAKQIDCVFEDIRPDSVKLGMLYDTNIIRTVAERLRAYHAENIVLDPVMLSSSGSALLRPDAAKTLLDELFPLCARYSQSAGSGRDMRPYHPQPCGHGTGRAGDRPLDPRLCDGQGRASAGLCRRPSVCGRPAPLAVCAPHR